MQETSLHIQAAALRAASLYFHRGLRQCFTNDYAFSFDSHVDTPDLIMMRQVVHLPTSQSLVDDASFFALSPVKDFYRMI